jgi:hypothetical protein
MENDFFVTFLRIINNKNLISLISPEEMTDFYFAILEQIRGYSSFCFDENKRTAFFKQDADEPNILVCKYNFNYVSKDVVKGELYFEPIVQEKDLFSPEFVGKSSIEFVMEKSSSRKAKKTGLNFTDLNFKIERIRKAEDGILFERLTKTFGDYAQYNVECFDKEIVDAVQQKYYSENPDKSLYSDVNKELFLKLARQTKEDVGNHRYSRRITCEKVNNSVSEYITTFFEEESVIQTDFTEAYSAVEHISEMLGVIYPDDIIEKQI